MERKNVNLTDEQCQEIIEEIATTSLHRFESGNAQTKVESKGTGIENFSIDDIMPEQIPTRLEYAQAVADPPTTGEQPLEPPTINDAMKQIRENADIRFSTQSTNFNVWGMPFFTESKRHIFDIAIKQSLEI